jgi:hypothetical protein
LERLAVDLNFGLLWNRAEKGVPHPVVVSEFEQTFFREVINQKNLKILLFVLVNVQLKRNFVLVA